MKTIFTLCIIASMITLSSCSKDNDSSPVTANESVSGRLVYSHDIQPLLRSNCASCHVTGSRVDFTGNTASLKALIASGAFSSRVFDAQGQTPCSNLDAAAMSTLKTWYNSGSIIE